MDARSATPTLGPVLDFWRRHEPAANQTARS
jgi:hypothetical protein